MATDGYNGKILTIDELGNKKPFETGGFPKKGELFICGNNYEPEEVFTKEKSNVMGEVKSQLDMEKLKSSIIWEKKYKGENDFVITKGITVNPDRYKIESEVNNAKTDL